jgi:hypothetical protein
MAQIEAKSLNTPDEVRTFDKGKLEIINIDGRIVGRATLQPGLKWSQSVKPLVNTKSARLPFCIMSPNVKIKTDDGTVR